MLNPYNKYVIAYLIVTTIICILLLALIQFEGLGSNLTRIVSNGWILSTLIVMLIALLTKGKQKPKN